MTNSCPRIMHFDIEAIAADWQVPVNMLLGKPSNVIVSSQLELYQRHLTQIQASVIQKQAAHFAAVARSLRCLKYRAELQETSAELYQQARELMGLEV